MPFFDQSQGLTPFEKCPFFDFLNLLVLQPRKAFFRFRIQSKTFSWPIFSKKQKLEKWPFVDQNHGLTPFEICQFFDFLNFLFSQPTKTFSRSRMLSKTFSSPILPKKKSWENGNFGAKPWVNHFGKMSIFRLFKLVGFIAQKGIFSLKNIVKDIFLAYIASKKKLEKWPFLEQNHGLIPFEIGQFFDFLNFLF